MLRIKTKEAGSWLIGAVAGVCALVVTLTTLDLKSLWWVVIVATLGTFVGVSLFALWVMTKYVAYKLRPIYSTVFSRDVHTADVLDELKKGILNDEIAAKLTEVAKEVANRFKA